MAAPITMPSVCVMAPYDTVLNTKPKALTCADTQPRYEATMQRVQSTSTVRL